MLIDFQQTFPAPSKLVSKIDKADEKQERWEDRYPVNIINLVDQCNLNDIQNEEQKSDKDKSQVEPSAISTTGTEGRRCALMSAFVLLLRSALMLHRTVVTVSQANELAFGAAAPCLVMSGVHLAVEESEDSILSARP